MEHLQICRSTGGKKKKPLLKIREILFVLSSREKVADSSEIKLEYAVLYPLL